MTSSISAARWRSTSVTKPATPKETSPVDKVKFPSACLSQIAASKDLQVESYNYQVLSYILLVKQIWQKQINIIGRKDRHEKELRIKLDTDAWTLSQATIQELLTQKADFIIGWRFCKTVEAS